MGDLGHNAWRLGDPNDTTAAPARHEKENPANDLVRLTDVNEHPTVTYVEVDTGDTYAMSPAEARELNIEVGGFLDVEMRKYYNCAGDPVTGAPSITLVMVAGACE